MPSNSDFLFDRPIPGQSLTQTPGSMPYEQPPQYVTEDDALVYMLDRLSSREVAPTIKHALKKGVYASDITNGILLKSFSEGKITPDVAALIAKRTLSAVVATGVAQGLDIKDIKVKKPSRKEEQLAKMLAEDDPASNELSSGPGGSVMPIDDTEYDPLGESMKPGMETWEGRTTPDIANTTDPRLKVWEDRDTPDESNKRAIRGIMGNE